MRKRTRSWICSGIIASLLWSGGVGLLPGEAMPAAGAEEMPAGEPFLADLLDASDVPNFAGQHPRLFITADRLPELRSRIADDPEYYDEWHLILSANTPVAKAFRYLITEDEALGTAAISETLTALTGLNDSNRESQGRSAMSIYFWAPLVYDWCYDLLSTAQKESFYTEFLKFAQFPNKPPGFPISSSAKALSSHHVEGWYWHQLVIGLAVYDEQPAMWNGALDFFFNEHQRANNFWMSSGLHHQGAGYLGTRFAHPAMFSMMMNVLTDGGHVFDSSTRDLAYQHIFHLRPDGEMIRSGDMSTQNGLEEFKSVVLQQMANYYQDDALYHAAQYYSVREPVLETVLDVLTRQSELGERESLDGLPLVTFFPEPVGAEMVARSSWDIGDPESDDYLVQMRIGKYQFGNHQHMDMGTFQIYYKGGLTGDSGSYRGSTADYGTAHWRHFYRSTIAHNGLIIYNPEQIDGAEYIDPHNDGGIRFPYSSGDWQPGRVEDLINPRNSYDAGDLIARGTDEVDGSYNYAYISGDLTKGYQHTYDNRNPDRAEQVTRSMVTMPSQEKNHPLSFFVFDRIRATDEDYLKKFILHTADEPVITGNRIQSGAPRSEQGYNGELVSWTLLPQAASLEAVQGYKVGYGANQAEFSPGTVNDADFEEMKYRLEVSGSESGKNEHFLHAMTVSEEGLPVPAEAALIEAGPAAGAQLLGNTALFSRSGAAMSEVGFTLPGEGTQKVLVTDLVPGTYLIDRTDRSPGDYLQYQTVSPECGCVFFEGNPGDYQVTRTAITPEIAERIKAARGGDQTAPEVVVAAPTAPVTGTSTLTATATDNVGVTGVQLLLDGKKLGAEMTSAPYELTWDSSGYADGHYALTASVRDAAGNRTLSEPAGVIVHNEPGFLPVRDSFDSGAGAFTAAGSWQAENGKYLLQSDTGGLALHERTFTDDFSLRVDATLLSKTTGSRQLMQVFIIKTHRIMRTSV
ncbi:Ig-like domain-containing protein [Paenibacillus sp. 1P07SE]|uniref:Ig-like domain-containing protein n=1 Tax=Paenibacillus sp. 1P07SE TaxID=3132209 RepID=UPI0039A57925